MGGLSLALRGGPAKFDVSNAERSGGMGIGVGWRVQRQTAPDRVSGGVQPLSLRESQGGGPGSKPRAETAG